MKKLSHPDHLLEWKARIKEEKPVYPKTVVVTAGTCGRSAGALPVIEALKTEIARRKLEGKVGLVVTGCHGYCEMEPSLIIQPKGIFYKQLEPKDVPEIVEETLIKDRVIQRLACEDPASGRRAVRQKEIPFYRKQMRLLTENNFHIDPLRIEDYVALDGYQALCRALFDMTSESVIAEVKASGLRGRGGAGFPTGQKWEFCRAASGHPKYVICNADEGDPGAYMDRSLLEGNPHGVIEGMIIGAYGIGASEGYIYVRGDNPLAVNHIAHAIERARKCGLLGESILGSEFHFDIRLVTGAGVYVCGEETSLMASIEGRKAYPRQRPPFPAQEGLWGKPTNINNVETWANVPLVLRKGGAAYAAIGTAKSTGTKIFSLIGRIQNTGLVEVPMGITLREIVYDIGGGVKDGKALKAVQTGGPAGGCIPACLIDLPVDYDSLVQAGSMMGSGGMVVMDETTCMVDVARYFLDFLQDESCGKCAPCRIGTRQMFEILTRITEGRGEPGDITRMEELAATMKVASLCGLGQSAANPVISTLRYFREEYEAHIVRKTCPALVCKEIVSAPCQHVCPIGQEASTYIALVARGDVRGAADIIRKDNPLPSVCGRVCAAPCETACKAGASGDPIAIKALKRFALERAGREAAGTTAEAAERTKARVAVIGSGPAGLTAASDLARRGFRPTVFEALPVAGGMLAAGIPAFRLPRTVLEADIAAIAASGVEIRTGTSLGRDVTLDGLFADGYEAVFLATGAWKPLLPGLPGEDAKGVMTSLEFFKRVNLGEDVTLGKTVGVAGDGPTAIEAARAAIRVKDCSKVIVFSRWAKDTLPAYPGELAQALTEGVEFKFQVEPVKVVTRRGKLAGLECRKTAPSAGTPPPVKGAEFEIALDTLILAAGESPDTTVLAGQGVSAVEGGGVAVDAATLKTSRPGVFAGGDAVTGPAGVIEAMKAGRLAAEMIEKYLGGLPLEKTYTLTRPSRHIERPAPGEAAAAGRQAPACLSASHRRKSFKEVEGGLTEAQARAEAGRCLRCELDTAAGTAAAKASGASGSEMVEEPVR
jgi:NADH-quinone oxidoreductase subunit F